MRNVLVTMSTIAALGAVVSQACSAEDRQGSSSTGGTSGSGGTGGSSAADGAPPCAAPTAGGCGWFPQSGCAASETCIPSSPPMCCQAGSLGENAACAHDWDCAPALVCVGRTCRKFCQSGADCASTRCIALGAGATVAVCSSQTACSLLTPWKSCPSQTSCYPVGLVEGQTVTDCFDAGEGKGAGACVSDPGACAPGHACVEGACIQWCRMNASDCPLPQQCKQTPVSGKLVEVDGIAYGTCG